MPQRIFDNIYETDAWGGGSGPGSDPVAAADYIRFINHIIEVLKPDMFLDVGCGDCRMASQFDMKGATYIGTDVSRRALELAKRNMPAHTEFHLVDGYALRDFNTAQRCLVHCKDVLQHVSFPCAIGLIAELESDWHSIVCSDYSAMFDPISEQSAMRHGGYQPVNIPRLSHDPSRWTFNFTMKIGDHLKQVAVT
jgi:SAM-dependent methyltransferase